MTAFIQTSPALLAGERGDFVTGLHHPTVCFATVATVLSVITAAARADVGDLDLPPVTVGWSLVFEDSLTNVQFRGSWLDDNWAVRDGYWKGTPEGVRNVGKDVEGLLLLRQPVLRGAWRVEYEAMSPNPGDLSLVMGLPPNPGKVDKYPIFLFASRGNTLSRLIMPGKPVLISDRVRATPGRWHRLAVERSGGRFVAEVDGDPVMEGVDSPDGLASPYLAFYAWNEGTFRNLRVLTRPDADLEQFLSPTAVASESAFSLSRMPADLLRIPADRLEVATTFFHVSGEGNDRWSGQVAEPRADGTDGPFATMQRAFDAVAEFGARDGGRFGPIIVNVAPGLYVQSRPLRVTPALSGRPSNRNPLPENRAKALPVTFRGVGEGEAVISGGRRIEGFSETVVHGQRAWVADVPAARTGGWNFAQLWVNGERRERPTLPREGWYRVAGPADGKWPDEWQWRDARDCFLYRPGDLDPAWTNLTDISIHIFNYWADNRAWLRMVDGTQHLAQMDRMFSTSIRGDDRFVTNGVRYRVENVYEALTEPGEWYLDRSCGRLTYLPRAGESLDTAEVMAPVLSEVLRIEGRTTNELVREVWFEGLTFAHAEWQAPTNWPGSNQAANEVPGAIVVRNARDVGLRGCRVAHVGTYGVELAEGCWQITLEGNRLEDLGAGGIKVWHGCNRNLITDNTVAHGGLLFEQAVGLLIGRSGGNRVLHNHIHHVGYSGISVGWLWGYEEGGAYGNIVEYNDIHDIGRGTLSDMGGIYLLSPQPGTRLRWNRIHDVSNHTYGGWGIYTDEGSSFVLVENNLAYRCKTGSFNQHYGEANEIRNNIFAFSETNVLERFRVEPHPSFTFEHNIVVNSHPDFWWGTWEAGTNAATVRDNIYWNSEGGPTRFRGVDFASWQSRGLDAGSLIVDPKFTDAAKGDFSFKRGAPYERIGFVPFDLSGAGPRSPYR